MKELTDKCEHCGNMNQTGALHCDSCGRGFAGNLAVKYRESTKNSLRFFIFAGLGVLLFFVFIKVAENSYSGEALLAFLAFLSMGAAFVCFFCGIVSLFARNKYKYSDNTELAIKYGDEPEQINKESYLDDRDLVAGIKRKNALGKLFAFLSVPFFIAMFCFIPFIDPEEFSLQTAMLIVSFCIGFILILFCISFLRKATAIFKENVVREALSDVLGDCIYRPNLSINKNRIEAANLINGWNKFNGNDYIRGTYKGHMVEFSDIILQRETNTDDSSSRTVTLFHGHWLTCRLQKSIPAAVRLREGMGKGNVETESVEFNNKYEITADDPHYAFYVLTPHFMEYITAADMKAQGQTFFCFSGNTVHIALYNKRDAFEIPANKAARENPSIAREMIKSELTYITDILDELLKNEYLF